MRLSYCYPNEQDIREGVRRISEVVNRDLELVSLFGTAKRPTPGQH